ncbi:chromosome segregation protein SMC [Aestuariimicrobium kwangyangense]|uniref:chromosome segregation protein SMC n=1 Tax=Aestuariimicrobium kwangyangense TaxID=396389 RepID=UPI0003B387D4|nr:chromosome segregation protein SMC [Aestuariimicrobium kwangyangense]
MYLKSLTLRGFKSFASATTLNFEPGVTCVVGPNGSGKSNVVDALSWVMGEQGAKSLRGGKMEDVIFAGTSGRAPLGRAEVVLTIDNSDGALPIDYTEVTISRTMFRSGGSEYAINGDPARLLDVQDLLSDSGIGREMHVIVGQGQLDTILQATPEIRRGFIEEAAGVLKHRKRKEKALRKLESTAANLHRLNDLISEIRRQLKPLGRQAEVARKAALIQAEVRDSRARLLADDLHQLQEALASDLADEQAAEQAKQAAELAHQRAQRAEAQAEQAVAEASPRLAAAQENWYALAALRERLQTTMSIAAERMRNADAQPELGRGGRDPETLEIEARQVRDEESSLREEVSRLTDQLTLATTRRTGAEAAQAEADRAWNAQLRAIADRREGVARLAGQVNAMQSRLQASSEEISRLVTRRQEATHRADAARTEYARLEQQLAGLSDGESGLDVAYERAAEEVDDRQRVVDDLRERIAQLTQQRHSHQARLEALRLGLERKDAHAALMAAGDAVTGVIGHVAALLTVAPGWEAAVSAALGQMSEGVAVSGVEAAVEAVVHLRDEDLGRAGLLVGGADADRSAWPPLPQDATWLVDLITVDDALVGSFTRLLDRVAAVDDLAAARSLVGALPAVTAVTREGDVVARWYAAGGSGRQPGLIELQAAVDETEASLATVTHEAEREAFAMQRAGEQLAAATTEAESLLDRLHESDAQLSAVTEQLGSLSQRQREARAEAERLSQSIEQATASRGSDEQTLVELQQRLQLASSEEELVEPDPTTRDTRAAEARLARQSELEARLALRTAEEKAKALAGRADSLSRAASNERQARAKALARAEQLRREAGAARCVHEAAQWLVGQVELARETATEERAAAEESRQRAEAALGVARRAAREAGRQLDEVVQGAHRGQLNRIELRMRIEQLEEKAMAELGLASDVLVTEFGPDQPVPVLVHPDGRPVDPADDEPAPDPVPYERETQEKRLRAATRNLELLGRVNPLALEEFDAMQERHQFLAEQLDDLKRTRTDLNDIIDEVDARVEQVFAEAYRDVEQAFEHVFARLFPGGEGRLVLTDPGQWLTTGIEVEARPAGKKVKRLSLLSGGERSLVAVAFLVSLFMARPSPFYILDEVEAALDDTNLGRLLGIYEELRENSQLLVITHQKRTMEIADALYGVTMRGDGVSTVVSQRLRELAEA